MATICDIAGDGRGKDTPNSHPTPPVWSSTRATAVTAPPLRHLRTVSPTFLQPYPSPRNSSSNLFASFSRCCYELSSLAQHRWLRPKHSHRHFRGLGAVAVARWAMNTSGPPQQAGDRPLFSTRHRSTPKWTLLPILTTNDTALRTGFITLRISTTQPS